MGLHSFGSPQFLDSMISSFYPLDVYMPENQLSFLNDWNNCSYPITFNSIYNIDSDEYFYPENSTAQFSLTSLEFRTSRCPENFPAEHEPIDCYYLEDPQRKRLITTDERFPADHLPSILFSSAESATCGDYLVMPNSSPAFRSADVLPVSLNYQKPEAEAVALSPQSIAARQRRKRISGKTQELGRLVPGGAKMNTAEMLAAAAKYVKFLQAQVRILEFLRHSTYDHEDSMFVQLQCLLTSSTIQEKLYEEGKCILPIESVKSLQEDAGPSKVQ